MDITNKTIDHLADLAKLEFSREERETIRTDLERILEFVGKLNELNLDNVEPLIYISDRVHALRPDEVKQDISREEALKNAPCSDGQYFLVPKVIQK